MIAIGMDRAIDVPESMIPEEEVYKLGIDLYVDDQRFVEGETITTEEFYEIMKPSSSLRTSVPPIEYIVSFFKRILNDGHKEVMMFHLSSKLSGLGNAIRLASEQVNGLKCHIFDTKHASVGGGFAVVRALKLLKEGLNPSQIMKKLAGFSKDSMLRFSVMDLSYLKKGGRVSRIEGFLGTLLKIKPVLGNTEDGQLVPLYKTRSKMQVINKMVEDVLKHLTNRTQNIIIGVGWAHTRMKESALELEGKLLDGLKKTSLELPEFFHLVLPPALVCHGGPDLFGCAAYGEK